MVHPSRAPAFLLLLVMASVPGLASGVLGQAAISSDRPGIGSGATVIDRGVVQLETGIAHTDNGPGSALAVGQLFLRYGLSGVELEAALGSFVRRRQGGADDSGTEDIAVGAKLPLIENSDQVRLSFQGLLSLPTGSDGFSSEEASIAMNGLMDVSLTDRLGVGVNLSVAGIGLADESVWFIATPSLALTDRVGVYSGIATDIGFEGGSSTWIEGGLTLLGGPDVQLDVNGAWQTNGDRWFLGAGFATRWGG